MYYNKKTITGLVCLGIAAAIGVLLYANQLSKPATQTNAHTVQKMPAGGVPTTDYNSLRLGQLFTYQSLTGALNNVTEDSRCPTDVNCFWAGTVKVETEIQVNKNEHTVTLELNKPINVGGYEIKLIGVSPSKNSKTTLAPSDYRFTLSIEAAQ